MLLQLKYRNTLHAPWQQVTLKETESMQVTVLHDAAADALRVGSQTRTCSVARQKCPQVSLCLALLLKDMNSSETPFLISWPVAYVLVFGDGVL